VKTSKRYLEYYSFSELDYIGNRNESKASDLEMKLNLTLLLTADSTSNSFQINSLHTNFKYLSGFNFPQQQLVATIISVQPFLRQRDRYCYS